MFVLELRIDGAPIIKIMQLPRKNNNHSVEMQHSVATPTYLVHRALDNVLAYLTWGWQTAPSAALEQLSEVPFPSASPAGWLPLYTMVTFRPDISYSTLKRKAERQDRILGWGTAAAVLGIIGYAGLKWTAKR